MITKEINLRFGTVHITIRNLPNVVQYLRNGLDEQNDVPPLVVLDFELDGLRRERISRRLPVLLELVDGWVCPDEKWHGGDGYYRDAFTAGVSSAVALAQAALNA